MAKQSVINIRTDAATKAAIEALVGRFGITVSDAVNIFFNVALMEGGLPFEVKIRDPFYSVENQQRLRETIHSEGYVRKTFAELEAMENE